MSLGGSAQGRDRLQLIAKNTRLFWSRNVLECLDGRRAVGVTRTMTDTYLQHVRAAHRCWPLAGQCLRKECSVPSCRRQSQTAMAVLRLFSTAMACYAHCHLRSNICKACCSAKVLPLFCCLLQLRNGYPRQVAISTGIRLCRLFLTEAF